MLSSQLIEGFIQLSWCCRELRKIVRSVDLSRELEKKNTSITTIGQFKIDGLEALCIIESPPPPHSWAIQCSPEPTQAFY